MVPGQAEGCGDGGLGRARVAKRGESATLEGGEVAVGWQVGHR